MHNKTEDLFLTAKATVDELELQKLPEGTSRFWSMQQNQLRREMDNNGEFTQSRLAV